MKRSFIIICSAGLAMLAAAAGPARAEIEGKADIIDGDTLSIAGRVMHLQGIDAPELGQQCARAGTPYDCGFEAANALAYTTAFQWLKCRDVGQADDGAPLVRCVLGGRYDVGEKMVRQGWALPTPEGAAAYGEALGEARQMKSGLWAGAFLPPWEWRQGRR